MHRSLLFLTFVCSTIVLFAQPGQNGQAREAVPPEGLINSFENSYHQASHLRWTSREQGGYIAQFMWDNMPTEAHYNGYGEWLYTENYITRDRLPQTAQIHLRRRIGDRNPDVVGHHDVTPKGYFFVRFRSGNGFLEWRYDHEGNFVGEFR